MRAFARTFVPPGDMDPEVVELCRALNDLPGVVTFDSCCGHGEPGGTVSAHGESGQPLSVHFKVGGSMEGLFFLARCVDSRYWEHGHLWGIELSVGDAIRDSVLPTIFTLGSGSIIGGGAYSQAESLVENMVHHLNHEAFVEAFGLDLSAFNLTTRSEA